MWTVSPFTALPWTSVTVAVATVLSGGLALVEIVDLARLSAMVVAGPGVTVSTAGAEVTLPSLAMMCRSRPRSTR